MNRLSNITSVESRAFFEVTLLENFVNNILPGHTNKKMNGAVNNRFSPKYTNIEWRSAHIPVNGTVEIMAAGAKPGSVSRISIPVSSGFLVVCTKEGDDKYKTTWSSSMS